MLYNLIPCLHRVTLDLSGRYKDRDAEGPCVQFIRKKAGDSHLVVWHYGIVYNTQDRKTKAGKRKS